MSAYGGIFQNMKGQAHAPRARPLSRALSLTHTLSLWASTAPDGAWGTRHQRRGPPAPDGAVYEACLTAPTAPDGA